MTDRVAAVKNTESAMKYLFTLAVLLAYVPGQSLLAADKFPEFKIESCRPAETTVEGRTAQGCFQDEQNAKDKLKETWSSFDDSQKFHCQQLLKAGGMPSYVELLTCLEMKTAPTTPSGSTSSRKKKKSS